MSEQNNEEQTNHFNSFLEVVEYLHNGGMVCYKDDVPLKLNENGKFESLFSSDHKPMGIFWDTIKTDYSNFKKVEPLPQPKKWYEKEGAFPCPCIVSDSYDLKDWTDSCFDLLDNTLLYVAIINGYDKTSTFPFKCNENGNGHGYTYARPIKIEFLETE